MSKKTFIFLVSGLIIALDFSVVQAAPVFQSSPIIASGSQLIFEGVTTRFIDRLNYEGNAASATWAVGASTATNADNANMVDGYSLDQAVTNGANPTFGTVYTNNWFRSSGATGWYSTTYGGGVYMDQANYVRIYGGKGLTSLGNVGIGTNAPEGILHASSTAVGGIPIFERSGATTDDVWLAGRILSSKTSAMGNGFGSGLAFSGRVTTGTIYPFGYIGGVRDGADASGALIFTTVASGASNERMRIESAGDVGINTTNPGYKLDVQGGQINASGGLCIAGVCQTSWLGLGGGGGDSVWATSSTHIYNINAGNVGIGSSTPSAKLAVNGSLAVTGIMSTFDNGRLQLGDQSGGLNRYVGLFTGAGALSMIDSSGAPSVFVYGNYGLTIDSSTLNVGIGTTNSTAARLTIVPTGGYAISAGNYKIGSVAAPTLSADAATKGYVDAALHNPVTVAAVGSTPNANGLTLTTQALNLQPANASFPGVVTTGTQTFAGAKTFSSQITGSISGNAGTATALAANGTNCSAGSYPLGVDASGNAESCTAASGSLPSGTTGQTLRHNGTTWVANSVIYNNGTNVGIGTITPGGTLDVASAATTNGYWLDGKPTLTGEATDNWLRLNQLSAWANGVYIPSVLRVDGELRQGATDYGAYSLQTTGNLYVNTGAILAASSGNVGIGTAAPAEKLAVVGNVIATAYLYSSDKNLKTNIKTIDNPLAKILKLRGVTFDWKTDGKPSVGLIAQEVEKVFPEIVSGEEGSKAVSYGQLVAPLIEAIKEQQQEINRLEVKIRALEDRK